MQHDDASEGETDVLDLEERGWLPRHCRGDSAAFDQLMHHYRSLVYSFLFRYGIDAQYRDDLFQEVFLKVHQAAPSYRPSQALRPWLVSIVLNTVRNHRRNEGRRWRFIKRLPHETEAYEPGADVTTERQATAVWIESRIGELPQAQREALTLTTIKGLQMKQIATLMEMPESTVKTHLRRARLKLAEEFLQRETQRGGTSDGKVVRLNR